MGEKTNIQTNYENLKAERISFSDQENDLIIVEDSDPSAPSLHFQPSIYQKVIEDKLEKVTIAFESHDQINKAEIKSVKLKIDGKEEDVFMDREKLLNNKIKSFMLDDMRYDKIEKKIDILDSEHKDTFNKSFIERILDKFS